MKKRKAVVRNILEILIGMALVYISLQILNSGFRAYFQCRTQCPLVKIVNSPWLYHGRRVTVVGFLVLQFEDNALYPSEESAKYPITNRVSVRVTDDIKQRKDELNLEYVKIIGVFDSLNNVFIGSSYTGTLTEISEVSKVNPRRQFLPSDLSD